MFNKGLQIQATLQTQASLKVQAPKGGCLNSYCREAAMEAAKRSPITSPSPLQVQASLQVTASLQVHASLQAKRHYKSNLPEEAV